MTRRSLLRAAGRAGIGAAGLALVGCGGDDDKAASDAAEPSSANGSGAATPTGETPQPATEVPADAQVDAQAEAEAQTAEAQPTDPHPRVERADRLPQRGGALRLHASLTELDFFDIHRSRFPLTQRFSALQQSRLLRYADVNTGTLEGDLVEAWETPDEESYVLLLRPGVRWWIREPTDGRPFSGEDVRRNVERQIAAVDAAGDPDPLFLRQGQYERTASVDLVDDETVLLRTDGPVGTYLSAVIAGPWSLLQAPEAWESFGDRLRDEPFNPAFYTGTGPMQMSRFIAQGIAAFQRNTGYFRPERPLLDAIEFAHLPDASSQEAAYRAGDIDVWSPGDPTAIDAVLADDADHQVAEQPLPFPIQVAFSYRGGEESTLRDPRVALAIHQGLDREAILTRIYGPHAGLSAAAPWFASGWAADVFEVRERPGYRTGPTLEELAELRAMAAVAADLPVLPLSVPDIFEQSFPGLAAETAASLSDRLGISVRAGVERYARLVEGLQDGSAPLVLGWGQAARDADPTLDLLETVHSEGSGNWGGFNDSAVDAAIDEMGRTVARAERQRIFRETLEPLLLERPSWLVNVGHGIQRSVYRPDVWLPCFGFGWDAQHYERAWRA